MLKFYSQIAVKIQKNPAKDKIFFQGAQKRLAVFARGWYNIHIEQ